MPFVAVCGGEEPVAPDGDLPDGYWAQVTWSGGTANLAVLPPATTTGSGPHPVLFALPWGAGTADLLMSFLDSYWSTEPGRRGYYVVGLEGRSTDLAQTADQLLPAVFAWMESNLDIDPGRVVGVGASNGGRGVFYAALSQPERFAAVAGLPGAFPGTSGDALKLAGIPVGLWVGEFDTEWVATAEATVGTLEGAGVSVDLTVVPGGGHVLILSAHDLMDWIDAALAR
jgi:predicted esterase